MPRRRGSTQRTRRSRITRIFGQPIGRTQRLSRSARENFFGNNFMPQVPIIMPQLGESIAEATIVDVKVKPGDEVVVDQEIIEVETNKAVMGVTTPCKGKIDKITVQVKETYPVGAVLGYVEASEADAAKFVKQMPPPQAEHEVAEEIPGRAEDEVVPARQQKVAARSGNGTGAGGEELPVPAVLKGAGFLSP